MERLRLNFFIQPEALIYDSTSNSCYKSWHCVGNNSNYRPKWEGRIDFWFPLSTLLNFRISSNHQIKCKVDENLIFHGSSIVSCLVILHPLLYVIFYKRVMKIVGEIFRESCSLKRHSDSSCFCLTSPPKKHWYKLALLIHTIQEHVELSFRMMWAVKQSFPGFFQIHIIWMWN